MKLQKLALREHREPLSRSESMSRIRSRNTAPERRVASCLYALGIRYRRNAKTLIGKPDFSSQKHLWAIFVHGCFWHSHDGCPLASSPKSNADYWLRKLRRNAERDAMASATLKRAGYRVYIVWECETRDAAALSRRVKEIGRAIARSRSARRHAKRSTSRPVAAVAAEDSSLT